VGFLGLLQQLAHDVRRQWLRTLLAVLGITWGTMAVSLLSAFGESLEKRVRKNQHGLGENIVIAFPGRTTRAYQGLGKGRPIHLTSDDVEVLRQDIPGVTFSAEHRRRGASFRRASVRLRPDICATGPPFARMRNLVPAAGGRYLDEQDVDRRRRVVFLGDKLERELFQGEPAVGRTVMIDGAAFLVIGVMQPKAQDATYGGRDEDKAFIPDSTYRALYGDQHLDDLVFHAPDPASVPAVTRQMYDVLARRHRFDPDDKEALALWDTTEAERLFGLFFGALRGFLAIVGSFTLVAGGIGVSNVMYVVVAERRREIGIKLALGARPRQIRRQLLLETLVLTAMGGTLGLLATVAVVAALPAALDPYVGTPQTSPATVAVTAALLGLVGGLAGYFPGRDASLLDPAAALRST
jgi:putative ABC transport system permease protein